MIGEYITIPIPFWGRFQFEPELSWYGRPVGHSPKVWPWWKLFKLNPVRTNPDLPRKEGVHSFNFWIYTRKDAVCVHIVFCRRGK